MADFSETTIQPDFYAPWPKFGKPFSRQLNESRQNFDSLSPVVRAHGVDPNYTEIRASAVASVEVGETNFHNRYRLWWDKTNSTFRIQSNVGTTNGPSWRDSLIISPSGEIVGDFYVSARMEVKDTSDIAVNVYSTDSIVFNREHFYITPNSAGEPVINFTGTATGGGGGVTAHGALTGLLAPADDHTQYLLASAATDRATFAANWTDLTDSGGTALHTHTHSALAGLAAPADDHTQYLLIDGTRAMTADLNMGGSDLINAHEGVFSDVVKAEAFYVAAGFNITQTGNTALATGARNLTIGVNPVIGVQTNQIQFQSQVNNHLRLTSSDTTASMSLVATAFANSDIQLLASDSITFDIGTSQTEKPMIISNGGVSIKEKITAEAFYYPGGEVVHSVTLTGDDPTVFRKPVLKFNRGDFYVTPDSSGNPIVNLAGSAPIGQVLAVLSADMPNITAATITPLTGLISGGINIGGWTIGDSSITVPAGVSKVKVIAQVDLSGETASGTRNITILKNGTNYRTNLSIDSKLRGGAVGEALTIQATSFILDVVPGDTLGAAITVSSGSITDVFASVAGINRTWLYVEEVRASGGSGQNVTISDGSLPNYIANTINLNPTHFYLTPTSDGPMVNLVDPLDQIIVTDGVNRQEDNVLNFSAAEFYVSTNLRGEPVVNLISPGGGTALTIADEIDPTFTSVSKITFDDFFYLTPDSTGQPKVNYINKYSSILALQVAAQGIANNSNTPLVFESTVYNTGGWSLDTGTGIITVPSGITHIRVTGQCRLNSVSANGRMSLFVTVNGSQTVPPIAGNYHILTGPAGPTNLISSYLMSINAGDLVALNVLHVTTAGTIDTIPASTWFGIEGYDYA